ncbi:MAG: VCBS repeat-containing protein [Vicinamibacteria bacterium]
MRLLLTAVGVALLAGTANQDLDLPRYHDIAQRAGTVRPDVSGSLPQKYLTETTGSGAAFLDFDGDGRLDLYVVNGKTREQAEEAQPGPPNELYRNLGDGSFVEIGKRAGVAHTGWGGGVAVADYDNDGDPDLLVTNNGPNVLYRNNGDGTFADVTSKVGLRDDGWSTSAAFGDINADGNLDLYVCNYIHFDPRILDAIDPQFCRWKGLPVMCGPRGLPGDADSLYLNRGDGTFVDITEESGVGNAEGRGLGVAFLDFDLDGDQDIYVANDSSPDFLYRNDGQGHFLEMGLNAGIAFSMYGRAQAGMGVDSADFDEDGNPDLAVTNFQGDYNALRRNLGGGVFADVSDAAGLSGTSWGRLSWGVKFFDANLDGFQDLFVVSGHIYPEVDGSGIGESYAQSNQLLINTPRGSLRKFTDVSEGVGISAMPSKSSRGLAVADVDNDGDWDLFINDINETPTFLRDEASHQNHWARLSLVGRKANRDGVGARVVYRVNGRSHFRTVAPFGSYLASGDLRLLLGLGGSTRATQVRVHWPGSEAATMVGPLSAGDQAVILEGVGRVR